MTRLAPRFIAVAILITVCGASISAQPETEAELRAKAEQGDVAWQAGLWGMYAFGRGVALNSRSPAALAASVSCDDSTR